jgi:hypothetical protein
MQAYYPAFAWRNWGKPRISQSEQLVSGFRFESGTSQILSRSANTRPLRSLLLPSVARSSKWSLPFKLPKQNFALISPMRAAWPVRLNVLRSENREALHYGIFSSLPSCHPSQIQILLSPCYQTHSLCILILMSETKFHTHTKQQVCALWCDRCTSTGKPLLCAVVAMMNRTESWATAGRLLVHHRLETRHIETEPRLFTASVTG